MASVICLKNRQMPLNKLILPSTVMAEGGQKRCKIRLFH